jgi:hypothetical protein
MSLPPGIECLAIGADGHVGFIERESISAIYAVGLGQHLVARLAQGEQGLDAAAYAHSRDGLLGFQAL